MAPSVEVVNTAVEGAYEDALKKEGSEHSSSSHDDIPGDWENITKPGPHDVLLGRGGGTNNHSGNVKFRKLVNEHKMRYLACSKVEKPKVAREVVQLWRKMDPPGRFLARKDESKKGPGSVKAADNVWYEVGDKKAREKASQCLRERTPDVLPYIKQLREQQDAITEQGVSMVQHQLQMQQEALEMNMNGFPSPAYQGRRSSLPVPGNPAFGGRRTSVPAMANPGAPTYAPRRTSLPPASQMGMVQPEFGWQQHPEDDFYGELSDLEYQQKMMMMQQQMHRMQMQRMQQQRLRMQQQQMRAMEASAYGDVMAHQGMERGIDGPLYGTDSVEPLPVQHDPLMSMNTPVTPLRVKEDSLPVVSAEKMKPPKRVREPALKAPERTPSNSLMGLNSTYEDGELTLEEYRQQLEEYITNTQQAESSNAHGLEGEESDLEDDWEKEKEKAYRFQQHERKRGVNRNASGCSFMSAKTTKSNKSAMSMVSGISMFSDMMMSQDSGARENKMNMARSVSSNLSLMSELTDLSQNIDNLSIYDD